MTDPYQILGVDREASDEEIKRAYRRLAKQYHPDTNPGDEAAARKMQEINDAYDRIKNPERYRTQSAGGYYQQTASSPELQTAYSYILYRQYGDARIILDRVQDRSARWYYLSALAYYGLGSQVTALEHMRRAVSMEPDNLEYLAALSRLEHGGDVYRRQAGNFQGFNINWNPCTSLCLCWLCKTFCGGNYWLWFCC